MGALLQMIGKSSDQQVAAETHRRPSAMKLTPGKPQLLCRSIDQAGNFGFEIAHARLSCATVSITAPTRNAQWPARGLATPRIIYPGLHALTASPIPQTLPPP